MVDNTMLTQIFEQITVGYPGIVSAGNLVKDLLQIEVGPQQLTGLRYDNWKLVFMEQRAPGTLLVWANPFTSLRLPKVFNLRTDPYERADVTSNTYYDWLLDHAFLVVPAQDYVGKFLATLKEYPPRQKAASFNLDEVMKMMTEPPGH